jgi:hypothetical protein
LYLLLLALDQHFLPFQRLLLLLMLLLHHLHLHLHLRGRCEGWCCGISLGNCCRWCNTVLATLVRR